MYYIVALLFYCFVVFFFFQAEDGIRDPLVTGVQTCALPIYDRVQRGGDRAQQPMPRADRPIADVLQEERARAVGALGVARSEASLAEERCLLVPSHAGDWQSVREKTEPRRDAIIRGTWPNIRQHSFRHTEVPAQFLVPRGCLQVQEQRARSVRHVGRVHAPAGEAPDEITINRAPGELAGLGTFSQLCIMI